MSKKKVDSVTSPVVKGYKGFNNDFQCTPEGKVFQYEVGKTYEQDEPAKLCKRGFHFCEDPLGIFNHYPPTGRFAEVEGEDVDDDRSEDDTKRAARKIHIKAEIKLPALIKAAIDFRFKRVDWDKAEHTATGDQGAASATGDQGAASATGYQGAASATGDQGAASATGYQGAAVSLGIMGKAQAALGGWITLAEWKEENYRWERIDVQTKRVDGEVIKADTFYMLKGGEFVEAES